MTQDTLKRAIEIKEEIEKMEEEIDKLLNRSRKRIFDLSWLNIEKRNNKTYAIGYGAFDREVLVMNSDDTRALIDLRVKKIKELKDELANL